MVWRPGMRSAKTRNRKDIFRWKKMASLAAEAGGKDHHFRFVQLPLNLAMPEALTRPNQVVAGKTMAMVQAGRALGITLIASAALLQGQLTRNLPTQMRECLGNERRFEPRIAIRPFRSGHYHGTCRHEPARPCRGKSDTGGRRTCGAR